MRLTVNMGKEDYVSNTKVINTYNPGVCWNLLPFGLKPQIQTWLNFKTLLKLSANPQGVLPFMVVTLSTAPTSACAAAVFPALTIYTSKSIPSPICTKYTALPAFSEFMLIS